MEHFKPAFNSLISQVRKTASFTVTFFALFLYQVVLDEHLKCLCKDGVKPEVTRNQCFLYMFLPVLILFLFILWMDGDFQRVLRIPCICRCNLLRRLVTILIKAAAIGMLWVVSVFIDGDWYVCYQRAMLPCRNNTTPSEEELEKQLEARFKTESMVIGLGLVLGLLLATSILTAIPWMDICYVIRRKCTRYENINVMDSTIKTYHMALYEENIKEEINILIEKDLKRTAKERVVLKIRELLPPSSTAAPPTTTTTQGGGGASSSNTRPEVEDSSSSTTTNPEVEDRVITLDNLDFDKISDLYSDIICSLFTEPPGAAASPGLATP
ncbi:uncharacterized protein LOC115199647 [Salmo trutta]|uniref:uncharacterized protein LOC115199646 n=1 Tax=Salmo trutta TaxID=8032 RepID=UPI001132477A|nr:uncharacterized protein LOC115199646 [Salmo trutta]XP_029617822.1 uncharacterized protein LOC115199647 [Salmo trutta]